MSDQRALPARYPTYYLRTMLSTDLDVSSAETPNSAVQRRLEVRRRPERNSMTDKQHVVFIAGLNRSGTTALHFRLATHPNLVAVGEAYGLLRPGSKRLHHANQVSCSCGAPAAQCDLWSPVVHQLQNTPRYTGADAYRVFIRRFTDHFGPERMLVDSSKTFSALEALRSLPNVNAKIVYMIRDVSGWTVSLRNYRSKGHKAASWQDRNSLALFWRWYKANQRNQQLLHTYGVPWIQLPYEELTLNTEAALHRLSEFLGQELNSDIASFADPTNHSVLGNRMKVDATKMRGLRYDPRWFTQTSYWQLASLALPHIMRYNRTQVYPWLASP